MILVTGCGFSFETLILCVVFSAAAAAAAVVVVFFIQKDCVVMYGYFGGMYWILVWFLGVGMRV